MPGPVVTREGKLRIAKSQKLNRAKVGLLELAKQLGNGSQACKMLCYRKLQ